MASKMKSHIVLQATLVTMGLLQQGQSRPCGHVQRTRPSGWLSCSKEEGLKAFPDQDERVRPLPLPGGYICNTRFSPL